MFSCQAIFLKPFILTSTQRRSKASKIGQLKSKLLRKPQPNLKYRYYVGTNCLQDIQYLTIMLGKEKTQKAVKQEQEAFARLAIERKLTEELIGNTD